MTMLIVSALVIVVCPALLALARRASTGELRRDRRDWPTRVRLDYETERVRDHLFEHLTPEDVSWMVTEGWTPPAEVARRWKEVARFRRLASMTPAEMDAFLKARAAGIHLTAHPDDLRFSPGGFQPGPALPSEA